jgi:hypothetical protein
VFYEQDYQNLEQIFQYIVTRASRSKKDQEQAMNKLFEILKPFSEKSIGKRFDLHEIYNSKDEIILRVIEKDIKDASI